MYKTCFECPHISYQNRRGRPLYWCSKLTKIFGIWFYLDKVGHRPKCCPLLKKKGEKDGKH